MAALACRAFCERAVLYTQLLDGPYVAETTAPEVVAAFRPKEAPDVRYVVLTGKEILR